MGVTSKKSENETATATDFDAVIVGAGFAGMYMLHRLRQQGLRVRVVETGSGVGGTWYWNRYPGARCDVESMEYSYQFSEALQQDWEWSERYSPQPEILAYANHVADRFDLRGDIQFNTRVESAHYNESNNSWSVKTSSGENLTSRFCIMATGCLSSANTPDFKGLESFKGASHHTGNWPHSGVDFTGLRVGVIGSGSSAIQSIPLIANQASTLTVFQRTPNYSVPAQNRPLEQQEQQIIKSHYRELREQNKTMPAGFGVSHAREDAGSALDLTPEQRQARYEEYWELGGLLFMSAFDDTGVNADSNKTAAEFVRNKIRQVVDDPQTADLLCPDNTFGCKRLCADTRYFQTYNRPNVNLVNVKETPIDHFTAVGLVTGGVEYELDAVVFATGFDAMTGALQRIDIRGKGALPLNEKWEAGPRTYLGLCTEAFPNLFTITGPGSPSVLTNMLPSIEQHVDWISECIAYLDKEGLSVIEADIDAENDWVEHVNELAEATLFPTCNSWYLGANVPGKPRVFMPHIGFPAYVEKCKDVVAEGYQGFSLS
ncbi:MAG: NAD(P)/FAD-dependent oxidoreductase [Oceanicoccus sp.]